MIKYNSTKKLTTQQFIEKAKTLHGNKYNYDKVEYKNNATKVIIICKEHGEFLQTPSCHLNSSGCLKCSIELKASKRRFTQEQFVEKANKIHNNKYSYDKAKYFNVETKICIICPIHGEFWQIPLSHLRNYGCPKCNSSKGESAIRKFLIDNNILFEKQKRFNNCVKRFYLSFDFYIPDYNLIIEYDGIQHFKPTSFSSDRSKETKEYNLKQNKTRDQIKNQYCLENNIKLLRIPYFKFKNIGEILFNYLSQILKE